MSTKTVAVTADRFHPTASSRFLSPISMSVSYVAFNAWLPQGGGKQRRNRHHSAGARL